MTRRAILQFALGSTAVVVFLAAQTGSSFAQDETAEDRTPIVLYQDLQELPTESPKEPIDEPSWFGPNFHLHKKSGFAYTREVKLAERPFVFRIQGPVLRRQEAVGLAFKIRF